MESVPPLPSAYKLKNYKKKWIISCHISKQRRSQSSEIAAPTDGELMSPKGTQEGKNTCNPAAITMQPHSTVSSKEAQDVEKHRILGQDSWNAYQRNDFNEPITSHLPIHRKALNSLTWEIWLSLIYNNLLMFRGCPCGSAGKESVCNEGDLGSISGLGRSPGEGKGYPLQYSGLENSMDCVVHGKESDTTEQLSLWCLDCGRR